MSNYRISENTKVINTILQLLKEFSRRNESKLVKLCCDNNIKQTSIAKALGVSRQKINQLYPLAQMKGGDDRGNSKA